MDDNAVAAHRIADALRTVAENIQLLQSRVDMQPEASSAALLTETPENKVGRHALASLGTWLPALAAADTAQKLEWTSQAVRAAAPFALPTDEEKKQLFECLYDMACDDTPKDRTWGLMDDMQPWEMRVELEWMAEMAAEEQEDGE